MDQLSRFLLVKQHFPDRRLPDVRTAVQQEWAASGLADRVKPGARLAIGVGSRGISNIAAIVGSTVDFWLSRGCRPFLFPAMGSHGGATAEGQEQVLARYGIDASTMGCPIVSRMEVVSNGLSDAGVETYADQAAMESDAILLINRIKWHTSFQGAVESGLTKMAAIGLGKIDGAKAAHRHARALGLERVITSVAQQNLATGKLLGGLGILEDANHHTAKVAALTAENWIEGEKQLFSLVKSWMGRIPLPLDILMLDEIGKNISGTGMDMKVVNRGIEGQYNPWPGTPVIKRIFLRDLSAATHGSAVGVGFSDVIHDRLLARIDDQSTWINAITSGSLAAARVPVHYPSDRACLEMLAQTVGRSKAGQVTAGWLRNSLELGHLALTENLRDEIAKDANLEIVGPAFELDFDAAGNLSGLPAQVA